MSRYIDNQSGQWFDTLAELKAFQRGEVKPSPQVVSKVIPETNSDVEVEPEVNETKEVSNEQEVQKEEEETEVDSKLAFTDEKISFNLSPDEMRKQLKDAGIDGRTLRRSDEDLAKLYVEFFSKRV